MTPTKPKPAAARTPATIQTEIVQAERSQADAQTALDRLMQDRPGVLVNGSDADLKALDDKQRQALVIIERQAAKVDALRRERVEAERVNEEARRTQIYEAAKIKVEAAAAGLEKSYPALVKTAHVILKALAEGQAAAREANAQLPAGAEPLADPEMTVRAVLGQPREIVSEEEVELWSRLDLMTPVDAAFQDSIHDTGNGWGKHIVDRNVESVGRGDQSPAYRLRRFRRIEYRDATNFRSPTPLAATIRLPNLTGDLMAWGNSHPFHDPAIAAAFAREHEPHVVLARMAEIEAESTAKPASTKRPIKIEFELLGDVVPLPVETVRPETTSRREVSPTRFGSSPFAAPARAGRR